QKACPGASLAVAHQGRLVAWKGLGHFTYDQDAPLVQAHTIYDLASLTKVLVTTAICMRLHELGSLHLDENLVAVLPEFAGNDPRRSQVTLRMLLAHSSGLPAYVKLFETAKDRGELLVQALELALAADPGALAEYSDIGFILLGAALERLAGETLDAFCGHEIFRPLDLIQIGFNLPRDPYQAHIPPTEHDKAFRHCIVQGEVHDENAWVMGGVAGHAGCFADAYEVAAFAQCMLNGGAP